MATSRVLMPRHRPLKLALLLSLLVHCTLSSQTIRVKGMVKDELTLKPVTEANIRIYGTNQGTATDRNGNFELDLDKLPVTIVISCVGYQHSVYDVLADPGKPLVLLLRPTTYSLKEVVIRPVPFNTLFNDKIYSVLDYTLMGDQIAILVYRSALRTAEMAVIDRSGDTLATADLPELPPQMLYKDFLSNVHYCTAAGSAYQFYYDTVKESMSFPYHSTMDSLWKYVGNFLFRINDRLYFQEPVAGGFGTALGYESREKGKTYIKRCMNEKKITEFLDDREFYSGWNTPKWPSFLTICMELPDNPEFNFSISQAEGGGYGPNEARAHKFEFFTMIYPMVKISDDTIAFFDFGNNRLEMINPDGKVMRSIPILFHLDESRGKDNTGDAARDGQHWCSKIFKDEATNAIYTTFSRNGMVRIRKIDPSTGNLAAGVTIPFPFPEKIEIYKGEAYFLCKGSGSNENWRLLKCSAD